MVSSFKDLVMLNGQLLQGLGNVEEEKSTNQTVDVLVEDLLQLYFILLIMQQVH